jgi:hypothetical protein
MNNLTWSGSTSQNNQETKGEIKSKKKVDYKKDLTDLQKILERLKEKYEIKPTNPISSSIVNLVSTIECIKREMNNTKDHNV